MTKLRVGDKAPDFSLSANEGVFSLSQFYGKKNVVIFFYPMDESPVCSREAEAFRDKYDAFKKLDAEVVGISAQSAESHRKFATRHNLRFILLSDADKRVRTLYGVSSTLGVPERVTFVINKEGLVKFVFSSQLQPARHANEALRALRENSIQK